MKRPPRTPNFALRLIQSGIQTAAWAPLLVVFFLAACDSSKEWTAEERADLVNNCLTNVRIGDLQLKEGICRCWLERTEPKYSYIEVNSGNQTIQADFIAIGKACSAEHGVKATLPGEQ
ncbi:hypothetical protein MK489_08265 [Myxococcota bacterium]|nr:hypothetical protein [Myxococcota bacterium]